MSTANIHAEEGRGSERDQETRRRILQAAERLFLAKGFKGVAMKDIAEEVQVTSAALYYHYPEGKQELYMSMVVHVFEEWYEGALQAIAHVEGIREQLLQLAMHGMNVASSGFIELVRDLNMYCQDNKRKHALIMQSQRHARQRITAIFQQAIDAGETTAAIPASIQASMYQGMLMGVQHGLYFSAEDLVTIEAQELAQMLVNGLLDGLSRHGQAT